MKARFSALARTLVSGLMILGGAMQPAAAEPRVSLPQNIVDGGVAVHGYDVVAYFAKKRPLKGVAAYEATYKGATYRFASATHKIAFLANPEKYVPSYGGFCAYGMRVGLRSDVDPKAWAIHGGRLFLMHSRGEEFIWREDPPVNVKMADRAWNRLVAREAGS